jgi:hypothetical protein
MGQVIARLAYELLTTDRRDYPALDLALRATDSRFDRAMLGAFEGRGDDDRVCSMTIGTKADQVTVRHNGVEARLFQTWSSRIATNHPDLRRFNLTFDPSADIASWIHGATIMSNTGQAQATAPVKLNDEDRIARLRAWVGRYRSYSPWYPTFRIVLRDERLFLIAPGGVEAPTEDVELVGLEPGVLRIGIEAHLPERLILDGIIDGKVVTCLRDGCRYSRTAFD